MLKKSQIESYNHEYTDDEIGRQYCYRSLSRTEKESEKLLHLIS